MPSRFSSKRTIAGHSSHRWTASLLALGLFLVALPMGPAAASCGGVGLPRVRYHCDTIPSGWVYGSSLDYMKYNEIYEGSGADLVIYFVDGASNVYKSIVPGTLRAICGNQDASNITAQCDYLKSW